VRLRGVLFRNAGALRTELPRGAWELYNCDLAGSQAPAWEPSRGSSGFPSSSPRPYRLNQPRLSGIITCAGIAPILRLIGIAAFHGILMNVIQLLMHNRLGFDDLRMITFFPYLMRSFLFMSTLEERRQFQQLNRAALFQMRADLLRRIRFKSLYIMA